MKLQYHKMMSPSWLRNINKKSDDFKKRHGVRWGTEVEWNDVEIMVPADTRFNEALFHVPLIPKNKILQSSSYAVKIVAGLEYKGEGSFIGGTGNSIAALNARIDALNKMITDLNARVDAVNARVDALQAAVNAQIAALRAQIDSLNAQVAAWRRPVRDPMCIMVAGKFNACGFEIRDPSGYKTQGPYRGVEGIPGERGLITSEYLPDTASDFLEGSHAHTQQGDRWPQVFRMNLFGELGTDSPGQRTWGSISSDVDGGHVTSFLYNKAVDPATGLRLAVYRGERNEAYRINYFEVSVYFT